MYRVIPRFVWPICACVLALILAQTSVAQIQVPLSPQQTSFTTPQIEAQVSDLLKQMTLAEKIGQLVQYSGGNATGPGPKQGRYLEMAARGEIGSLLNVVGTAETNSYQHIAMEKSRLHIPILFGYDVIHGYRTSFPVPLGLAASFSPELIQTVAGTASDEAAEDGIRWVFSPMVDISRDARWGRVTESAGEDTYLDAALTRAWVKGIQHQRADGTRTAACVKHFAAYGAPIAGRDYNAVDMSPRLLYEDYLPPYRAGVEAGAFTLMSSFNSLNGVPMTANRALLTDILRNQWGFRGFVVSDWGAVHELLGHAVVLDAAGAAASALHAGVDMDMEGDVYRTELAGLAQNGRVPVSEIDEAVRRVLRVKFALGLFDHPYTEEQPAWQATEKKRQLAREVAAQTLVLLKNDATSGHAVLPVSSAQGTVALIGPFADSQTEMLGSWSLPANSKDVVTLRSAMVERLGDRLKYAKGTDILSNSTAGFEEAKRAASDADLVIMALGESGPQMTGESTSRAHLGLPGNQEELLKHIAALGKPVVLVLFSGRPLAIPWAAHHVTAILESWYPGMEAGHAIADILFGDRDPVAHLPVSMPYAVGQEPLFYAQPPTGRPATQALTGPIEPGVSRFNSRYIDEATIPLYPFGWGLTYTSFHFDMPKLSRSQIAFSELGNSRTDGDDEEVIGVDVAVTNTGLRQGTALAQLYLRNEGASVEQPVRVLRGFQHVLLHPQETKVIHFALTRQDLSFYNQQMQPVIEPTRYTVYVGQDSTTTNGSRFQVLP